MLIAIYCKNKLLWFGYIDALIFVCNKSLGVCFILNPFSRVITVGSSLGPTYDLSSYKFLVPKLVPNMGFILQRKRSNYGNNCGSSSHNVHTTVARVGMSCEAGHCGSLQSSQSVKGSGSYFPLVACIAPSSVMKASQ